MMEVVKQKIGISKWNEMIEGRPKRTMEFLPGLSILDRWNHETIKCVKVFLEGVWETRVW
ncbi:MAG: hypothetical protein DSY42_03600 [Aquifex sp.]|nr:MAG: hypothetical protein DSY42_03600 [Aquifex sp.]